MERFGVYFVCLNVVSGSADLVDAIVDTDERESINTIDRAIQILDPVKPTIVDGPVTSTTDVVGRVRFDLPPPCLDEHCRDRCCRRGLVKRPGRKSSFTRPEP